MTFWRQGTCLAGVQPVSGDLTECRDGSRRPAVATDKRDLSKCQSWVMEQRELKLDAVPPGPPFRLQRWQKFSCTAFATNSDSPSARVS